MKRMNEVINSLPHGAQKKLAQEFNTSKSFVSAVLNGDKKPYGKGRLIQERAIKIVAAEMAKKTEERLKKKYLTD